VNKFGVPIAFSDEEIEELVELAYGRQSLKEDLGVETKKLDSRSSDGDLHYVGLKAEMAVAKLMGLEIDRDHHGDGDRGYDFVWRGLTIDVKYSQRDIKYEMPTWPTADILVLVQPLDQTTAYKSYFAPAIRDSNPSNYRHQWRNVLVVGWITSEHFKDNYSVVELGGIDKKLYFAHNMKMMESLLPYAERLENERSAKVRATLRENADNEDGRTSSAGT